MTTPTAAEVADALAAIVADLRSSRFHICSSCGVSDEEYAERLVAQVTATECAENLEPLVTALRALSAEPSAFLATTRHFQLPAPQLNIGGEPCGECHIQPGETCDICGARNPPAALSAEPSEAEVERAAEAAFLTSQRRTQAPRDRFPWASIDIAMQSYWRDIARAALRSRRAEGGQ